MSSAITAAAIGTVGSIYSGQQAGKRADQARSDASAATQNILNISDELKTRQQNLVDKPLEQKIAELQGSKITASGQQSLDRFNYDMANADRNIQEQASMAGEGVTGGRELTQQFRKASGIAGINLQDTVNKNAQLGNYMQLAQQTPGWVGVAENAYGKQASQAENQQAINMGQEQSAYGAAAKGLTSLADMYATYQSPQNSSAASGTYTTAQLRAAGLI